MIKKILVIIAGLALLVSCYFSVKAYQKYSTNYVKTYVASHQLNQRSNISYEDLKEVLVPKEYLQNDVYLDKNDIIGKYVKLSYSIPKGSLFYKGCLETDIKDLAHTLLYEGQVNYDIYVNEVKVNTGNLDKNIYVDLYLTIDNNEKPESDLLLSKARITGLYDGNGKQINDYDKESRVNIISLAIDKNDVSLLNKALLVGEIKIVVNPNPYSTGDKTIVNSSSQLFNYLQ